MSLLLGKSKLNHIGFPLWKFLRETLCTLWLKILTLVDPANEISEGITSSQFSVDGSQLNQRLGFSHRFFEDVGRNFLYAHAEFEHGGL